MILPLYSQYKRDLNMLEGVQQRTMEMMKGLEHLSCKRGQERWSCSAGEEETQRNLINVHQDLKEGAKMTEPGFVQWCSVSGYETMGTNWSREGSIQTSANCDFD